jgi:ketopantoate reductase
MARVRAGTIGILPAGALGVSFFYHLTRQLRADDGGVFFLERPGSKSAAALREKGELIVADETQHHRVSTQERCPGDFLEQFERKSLPEVLLLCPNPDQLPAILRTVVQLLERMGQQGELANLDFPTLVLASNGIYYQRLRQQFIEQLEEATLLGRLPDLWPDIMPQVVGRLLRGVTIQTGIRDGAGADAVYHPGPIGITRVAGGDALRRARAVDLLRQRGAWFELAPHSSATRLEFDKGIVNLITNLLGQFHAIDREGRFTPLRVRDLLAPKHMPAIRELAQRVFEVGQAVRAYGPEEDFEKILPALIATTHQHDDHIPSSLQWIGLRLRQGKLEPKLTPTEEWLLDPLIRYAHAAGLHDAGHYFEALKERAVANLKVAAEKQ